MSDLWMRDSVTASNIPLDSLAAVAGYGDGRYVWSSADWARFPAPIVPLSIVTSAANVGDILDIENGDATPAEAVGWCTRFNRPGRRLPTLYYSISRRQEVLDAGVGPHDWWAAWYTTLDEARTVSGAVAVQYVDTGGYDESIILDSMWLGADMTDQEHAALMDVLSNTNSMFNNTGGTWPIGSQILTTCLAVQQLTDNLVKMASALSGVVGEIARSTDAIFNNTGTDWPIGVQQTNAHVQLQASVDALTKSLTQFAGTSTLTPDQSAALATISEGLKRLQG